MATNDKNYDFVNLVQTRNLLDLELHELRPILYPKLLHLMETEKLNDKKSDTSILNVLEKPKSLQDFYIDENLIFKNQTTISRSLVLDDRCIVGEFKIELFKSEFNLINYCDLKFIQF